MADAGKSTYYGRLRTLLELAASHKSRRSSLVELILSKAPPNFVVNRWNHEKAVVEPLPSASAANNTHALAVELGLLDGDSDQLTKAGTEAADPGRFDAVVRMQIVRCLEAHGCPIASVNQASVRLLRRRDVLVPTADALFEQCVELSRSDLGPEQFKRLLRLLALCGGLRICRQHIFLPVFEGA